MADENQIKKAFGSWKIFLAIGLGLFVTGFMIYRSLSQINFVEVPEGQGSFVWIDANHNNKIDFESAAEFVAKKGGNYDEENISNSFSKISWNSSSIFWLILAIVFMFGRDFFYSLRIWILCKKVFSFSRAIIITFIWEFASALSPGVVGGAAVAMFIVNREGVPLGRSTAIVIITALMDNLFFILMIPFVFLFIDQSQLFPTDSAASFGVEVVFWSGFAIMFGICLILFASIFLFPSLATRFLGFIFKFKWLRKWRDKALKTGEEVEITSIELKKEPIGFWFKSFGATVLSWICRYLVINCILQAFLHLNFLQHITVLAKQLVLWLFMLISPTPGASGVAEYAFGELLIDFTESALLVSVLALLWRLISYFPYLIIGALILPKWLKRNRFLQKPNQ